MRVSWLDLEGGVVAAARRVRALAASGADVAAGVAETIALVRDRGDAALLDLSDRFDGARPTSLRVDPDAVRSAPERIDPPLLEALRLAEANVREVAEAQLDGASRRVELPQGQVVTVGSAPVAAAGIYVPGGGAGYPSSALMGSVPALVAGVRRVAVASPPGADGAVPDAVLAACAVAGVEEVYAIGGAQAVAALALGTDTVDPVDLIAGPGSARVQEAKLQLSRVVGIDGYAGPSELMVALDVSARLDWVALDLCAQAEHGGAGLLVAAAPEREPLAELSELIDSIGAEVAGGEGAPLALVATGDLASAAALAEAIAPEHLELACEGARELAESVPSAGCVFVGPEAGTAFGDYAAGSNHVLPTGGAGRFTGPLGPGTFRRPTAIVELSGRAAAKLAPTVDELARAEGFPVHGRSASARANPRPAGPVAKMEER